MLQEMSERLKLLDERTRQYDRRVERIFGQDERCQRLAQVEGIGPLSATALVAAVGSKAVASSVLGWVWSRVNVPVGAKPSC
jgi:transposase